MPIESPNFFSPENNYLDIATKRIANLPNGSIVYLDIDGTAVISSESKVQIREDFNALFAYLKKDRPDISIYALTYRSKDSGVPELSDYPFDALIFMEDMQQLLSSISRDELITSVYNFLSEFESFAEDYKLVETLLNDHLYKLQFLICLLDEFIWSSILIDDGTDGKIAQELGIGVHVQL